MKLLGWIFSITDRHRNDVLRYSRGGRGIRIVTLFISLLFITLAIGLELWFLSTFYTEVSPSEHTEKFLKLLVMGILAVATLGGAFDHCVCFCYVGFKTALFGSALSERSRRKLAEKKGDPSIETDFYSTEYRGLDILVGILELIFAIGCIALFVYLLFAYPSMK